jgi:hypothetical protein
LARRLERDCASQVMSTCESPILISPARTRMDARTRTGRTLREWTHFTALRKEGLMNLVKGEPHDSQE